MGWQRGILVVACVLVAGFFLEAALSTARSSKKGKVIYEVKSKFSHIRVRELGRIRSLYFAEPSGREVLQSSIDLDAPADLRLAYSKYMFASNLLRHPQERVLIVGLGGGGMVRFLNEKFPGVKVDAVEIDPDVVHVAAKFFGTKSDGKRNRIMTEDAFKYLARTRESYDVIYMDAFLKPSEETGPKGVPSRLKTIEFLRSLHKRLVPGGVMMFNLIQGGETKADIKAIRAAFPSVWVFDVPKKTNLVVMASLERKSTTKALAAAAAALDAKLDLDFAFEEMLDDLE